MRLDCGQICLNGIGLWSNLPRNQLLSIKYIVVVAYNQSVVLFSFFYQIEVDAHTSQYLVVNNLYDI